MIKGLPKSRILPAVLGTVLAVYMIGVCLVNASVFPGWYDADMYMDILYASHAWEQKTIFPEGWVFGNQFYVVSTPVIAALFCAILEPPGAMAAASVLVAFLVVASFLWMLKPAITSLEARLAGAVFFVAGMLYFGDAYWDITGWQLMFTMCSYYGIYAVNAFLAFGCYLRAEEKWKPSFLIAAAAACFLSFGTGMQSLRQTAIMTCPLIGAEILRLLYCLFRKQKPDRKPAVFVGVMSVCNVLGLVVIRMLDIPQQGIQARFVIPSLSAVFAALPENLMALYEMFSLGSNFQRMFFFLLIALSAAAAVWILLRAVRGKEEKALILLLLFGIGAAAVFCVGILGIVHMRPTYHFMLYPMIAFLLAWICAGCGKWGKGIVLGILAVVVAFSMVDFQEDVLQQIKNREDEKYREVADFLVENGYTTLYTEWDNRGEDVAIASGCRLRVGYWGWDVKPYESIRYLCNPSIYDEEPERCAYLFWGKYRVEIGQEVARQHQTELTQIAYFPESELYLFTAPINLMALH